PEQNIAAGTRYLKRLIGIFSRRLDNPDEILRHTLAAYNVGEGNVIDYMEADGNVETEEDKWPEEYIQNVMGLYRAFCEICP
ncbi:MAG: transglycosylase SLT domain-containing protein, partial [Bacteroidales bacterium]|nr:transglycosylase SLT domain-containing protein [Bacteroidales bacterium]